MSDKIKRKVKAANSNAASFLEAIIKGKKESIGKYVKKGVDINTKDQLTGDTALHISIDLGLVEVSMELLKFNPDINATADNGSTPLHKASSKGMLDTVKSLLTNRAYIDAEDKEGQTPLYSAVSGGNVEVINFLLEQGANTDIQDKNENTLLHEASARNNPKILMTFLRKGIDVNKTNRLGCTALHIAAEEGNTGCITALLGTNIDTTIKNKAGDTAADLAFKAKFPGHEDIAKLLRKPPRSTGAASANSESRLVLVLNDLPPLPPLPSIPKDWAPPDDFPPAAELPPSYTVPTPLIGIDGIRPRSGRFEPVLSSPRFGEESLSDSTDSAEESVAVEPIEPHPKVTRPSSSSGLSSLRPESGGSPSLPPHRASSMKGAPAHPARPPPGPPPGTGSLNVPSPTIVGANSPRTRATFGGTPSTSPIQESDSATTSPLHSHATAPSRGPLPIRGRPPPVYSSMDAGPGGRGPPLSRGKLGNSMTSLPSSTLQQSRPPLRPPPGTPPGGM